jgi:hypothetical protein
VDFSHNVRASNCVYPFVFGSVGRSLGWLANTRVAVSMGLGCCRSHPSSVATNTKDESCYVRPNCDVVKCFFLSNSFIDRHVYLFVHLFICLHINTHTYRVNEKCAAKPTEGVSTPQHKRKLFMNIYFL